MERYIVRPILEHYAVYEIFGQYRKMIVSCNKLSNAKNIANILNKDIEHIEWVAESEDK